MIFCLNSIPQLPSSHKQRYTTRVVYNDLKLNTNLIRKNWNVSGESTAMRSIPMMLTNTYSIELSR